MRAMSGVHPVPSAIPTVLHRAGAVVGLLILLVLAGCGSERIPSRPVGTPAPPPTRPPDGLLERPALQTLVDLQVARDGEGLVARLGDPDPAVRARAAFALGSVQDPEAGRALVVLLGDSSAGVRRDAAFALGQLGESRYGPALLSALEAEGDLSVRLQLLDALGKVGEAATLQRLVELGPREGEGAAFALALGRAGLRGIAFPTSVGWLLQHLTDPDPRVRTAAAYYFGRMPTADTWAARAERVREALDGYGVEEEAAMHLLLALARLGDPVDTPRLLPWTTASPDWRIRTSAVRALGGRTPDPRVRLALYDALDDPSTHVGVAAAETLVQVERLSPSEKEGIREWIREHREDWRRAGPLLAALGRNGDGTFILEWLGWWGEDDILPRTRGLGALAFVPGEEATRTLVEAAGSPSVRLAGTALGALARRWRVERRDPTRHELYFRVFVEGLRRADPSTAFVTASVLADSIFVALGSVEALEETYRRMTLPEDLEGMTAVLEALGRTGDPGVEPLLREALRSSTPALREAAARGLSALVGEGVEAARNGSPPDRTVDWDALRSLGSRPRLVLETGKGRVVLELDAESAPLTVQTVAGFAAEGKYDGVPFHRVVPNFVVQGGDFQRQDGFGGPGFAIRSEFTLVPFRRGVVGMASAGKDTEGSQFFVTHSWQPHLDGRYTAFGWVVEGMDVVDALYEGDVIETARVEGGGA